ncbi:hypothetical protein FD724_06895 [Nostoc sp. C057]|uniref:hypothetical protein n=1 Tax=Nostoc sp. C057 TaxID=2576903 RepID=UPI0015C3E134|nr:hypothetical protein [Nostoc sp. C057]QLE47864.1 hypothetical protein FD724_06895 [Nostoc sp. C057]
MIRRTTFDNRFEPAIKDYAGLFECIQPSTMIPPKSSWDNQNNIDLMGNDLWTFFFTRLTNIACAMAGVGDGGTPSRRPKYQFSGGFIGERSLPIPGFS